MQSSLYSHRLKAVLQHSVCELGVTLSIDDETAEISLAENEALIREAATFLGINVNIEKSGGATTAIFYR